MGCAGSRPHLPSLGINQHSNSPHKGFILFDAKTIEYLRANESDIKIKLKERCELKLTKLSLGSKTSLLSNAKKTLLNTTNDSASTSGMRSNKSNVSLSGSFDASYKSEVISSAVDYVLKYALNDFDIENFKSSNQLSLKQIRKEIMKKNSKSSSKLNNSVSMNNASTINESSSNNNNALTSSSTMNDFNLQSKSYDPVFYKQALNSAIDEFGSFIQENFIVINEFDASKNEPTQSNENKPIETIKETDVLVEKNEETTKAEEEDEALKLKEALALARQNFYKGKVSTVCLTKGGYVVKEVSTSQTTLQTTIATTLTTSTQNETDNQTIATIETKLDQDIKVSESEETQTQNEKPIDDGDLVKQLISKAFDLTQDKLSITEFNLIKTHFVNLLNETIESIVNYTTKSSTVNESTTNDEFSFDLNASLHADSLIVNLEKAKRIIENLNSIDENDLSLVDEKLVEAILNLDFVNKEFKSYLKILEESQLKELETKKQTANTDNLVNAELLINKNIKIRMLADEIDDLNSRLPKKLFSCKCLPHPTEANQTTSLQQTKDTEEEEDVEVKEESNVDIKKEIAMSILNVGEIIAKTIDHYSSDCVTKTEDSKEVTTKIETDIESNEVETKQTESVSQLGSEIITEEPTVNQIIKVEEAKLEETVDVVQSNNELHINVVTNNEAKDLATTTTSTVSSLSSPSVSTSSMSPTQSISPVDKAIKEEEEIIDTPKSPKCNSLVEAAANLDLIEKFKCAPLDEKLANSELSYLENKYEENDSFSDLANSNHDNLDKEKSSSSSSDILTSSNLEVNHEVKFRNSETTNTNTTLTSTTNQSKRMSLDEELFYHLEDVDKKVKYMNETCSENEDDDDEDDENDDFDFDAADLENADDERLFHPRTPAKIKQDIKTNRSADLQNEIKQISNVIQDLVQTINVRNSAIHTKIDIIEEVNNTNDGHLILLDDGSNTNTNPDSEDGGSQNSADSTDFNPSSKLKYARNSMNNTNKKLEASKRLSLNSNNSFSNIPIRQKVLTKQKATAIEDDQDYTNKKTLSTSVNYEAFVDVTTLVKQQQCEQIANSPDILNKSSSSQKFRSKLPVKK